MSGPPRRRPSAATAVAVIALVLALTGVAVAGPARLAKKLLDGSSIKPNSIPGNRLKTHSVTGHQINLSKLGTVPRARRADAAANASKLGGAPPSAYLPGSKLLRWSFAMNKGQAARQIGTMGPLTFIATCAADGANTNATVSVKTSESGTFVTTEPDNLPGPGTTINAGDPPSPIVSQDTAVPNDGNSTALAAFDPAGKVAVFSTAQTLAVANNTAGANCRFFGMIVNDA